MVFSLVYTLVRWLIGLVAVLSRADLSKEVESLVLRRENAVLRRQLPRPRYQPADRFWFAALSRLVPRRLWSAVFPVTPATILGWHWRLVARSGSTPIGAGRGGYRQARWSRS
jgi:putative transposase